MCSVAFCAAALSTPAAAQLNVKKVVNGKFVAGVDNGWVVYGDFSGALTGTLNFYNSKANANFSPSGNIKLKTAGAGGAGGGAFFTAGGITFAPCPAAAAPNRCANSEVGSGVGIGFGQVTFGGAGGGADGWVSDRTATAKFVNGTAPFNLADFAPGSVTGVAIDAVNGAYAVGWDQFPGSNHAIIATLNTATPTYAIQSVKDLGTLGGAVSQAFAISKNALHVVGIAEDAGGIEHAVYALTSATSWTDITGGFPSEVIKSRALAVSNTGFVAGSATVRRVVAGQERSVDIGFVYDTNTSSVEFFELLGTSVKPMKVLDDGRVVGNLEFIAAGSPKANHPFIYDGAALQDLGVMGTSFGCRVNGANNLGELVGSCIPNNVTSYGLAGSAFYIDAAAVTPAFIDVNASIHTTSNVAVPGVKPYRMGSVTAIDDAHEITVMGSKTDGSTAGFIAFKPAYNP